MTLFYISYIKMLKKSLNYIEYYEISGNIYLAHL